MPPKTTVRLSSVLLTLVVLLAAGCGSVQTRTVTVDKASVPASAKVVTRPKAHKTVEHHPRVMYQRPESSAEQAQEARNKGLWGVQTQKENEEAGCKYGFTMSGETPHCNTREEGIRLQETFQREREDPQREAENAQAAAEVQSHEECVDHLGVEAC